MNLTPQHKQILKMLSDGKCHCPTHELFMKDDRKRISELNHGGFVISGNLICSDPDHRHSSKVKLRLLEKVPEWFNWSVLDQGGDFCDTGRLENKSIGGRTTTPESGATPAAATLKPREWAFESESMPGKKHHVVDFTTCLVCDCVSYSYRKTCKHVDTVKLMLETKPAAQTSKIKLAQGQLLLKL